MKNKSRIQGDNNSVYQGIKNSNVDSLDSPKHSKSYVIIGITVAILTLIATLIIGWENIEKFFAK